MQYKLTGIIPAVFTPMKSDFSLALDRVKPVVDQLIIDGVSALYVCGSTGEGPSLTTEERMQTAHAFVEASNNRLPVIVQVGHNSIRDAQSLARHASEIGVDAFSAVPPSYFKLNSLQTLVDCIAEIASAAPALPFYYYHIPQITGVDFDMVEFLRLGSERIPNLVGIKYSKSTVFELQTCLEFSNNRFDILFGSDEMMTSGLAGGARGFVGSTFNFAARLYAKIIDAFLHGDIDHARVLQSLSINMIKIMFRYRGLAAFKAAMELIGLECGPVRLPHKTLTSTELKKLKKELQEIGLFEWGRR